MNEDRESLKIISYIDRGHTQRVGTFVIGNCAQQMPNNPYMFPKDKTSGRGTNEPVSITGHCQ